MTEALPALWFIIIAILWTGYLVLEGFDFGVGMALPILGRTDKERRVLINTIGPVWDGNEVWLITAGGATFAAFPEWYATLFSGFYLPLLLILLALIIRGVAFEFRGKIDDPRWRQRWDWCIIFGSWVPAVLWGVAFANIAYGVAINADKHYVGGFWALLNPFALLGGLTTALVFFLHGLVFIALKTDGEVRHRARKLAVPTSVATVVVAGAFLIWLQLHTGKGWTWLSVALAAVALLLAAYANWRGREGWAFTYSATAIVATVVTIFGSLFPNVMPTTLPDGVDLTIHNAASTPYTLGIMTWVALALTPLVLLYQGWTYWVFRKRISTTHIPPHVGLPAVEPVEVRDGSFLAAPTIKDDSEPA